MNLTYCGKKYFDEYYNLIFGSNESKEKKYKGRQGVNLHNDSQ